MKSKLWINKVALTLLPGLTLITTACQKQLQYADILGNWQAFEVTEEGEDLGIDPSVISLSFYQDNTYVYKSTLNYQEAGNCRLEMPYLYTTDTTQAGQEEKVVRIINEPIDSLFIRMREEGGEERILRLVRSNQ